MSEFFVEISIMPPALFVLSALELSTGGALTESAVSPPCDFTAKIHQRSICAVWI